MVRKAGKGKEREPGFNSSEERIHILQGTEVTVEYQGVPIRILVAGRTLKIGRPVDLGIIRSPHPEYFDIIDTQRLSETKAVQGRVSLKDGGAVLFGGVATHGFKFGSDVARLHFGIKRDGDMLTIKDMNPTNGINGTVVVVPSLQR